MDRCRDGRGTATPCDPPASRHRRPTRSAASIFRTLLAQTRARHPADRWPQAGPPAGGAKRFPGDDGERAACSQAAELWSRPGPEAYRPTLAAEDTQHLDRAVTVDSMAGAKHGFPVSATKLVKLSGGRRVHTRGDRHGT